MAKGMSAGDRAMRSVLILLIAGAATPAMAAPGGRAEPAVETAIRDGAEAWEAGNFARALALWRPLAAAGNADAQYNLAQAYRLGRGVATDPAQARGWYLKAAEQGHAEAQANYGLMRFHAGERKDALPWLNKAAERGDARAQYVVGTALFNGDVAGKDWVRAYALMTRAAAAGLPQATTSLAEMDRWVPLGQRQQGTALARDMERS
ncbi:MAG: tetratricopeptide repeat protein, partial [Sphingomonas sp.]